VSEFVYASKISVPDYVRRGGTTYRVISDQLGSPRYAVNVANASDVPLTASYSAFGVVTGAGLDWMPFGFAGGIYDPESGLVRFGARDYDPILGRWTAKDPITFRGDSANLFGYVVNDPVNLNDPTGLFAGGGAAFGPNLFFSGLAAYGFGYFVLGPLGFAVEDARLDAEARREAAASCSSSQTPPRRDQCYAAYLSDTAYCGETWPDDYRYEICMNNAWRRYIRCLNGLPPDGPLVPR
jgi:RHS repeat-associated protein